MTCLRLLVLAVVVVPAPLAGQSVPPGWTVSVGLEGIRFGQAARDTVGADGAAPWLRPSGRIGVRVALQRRAGGWRVGAAVGWAGGNVEAGNDAVAIRDRTTSLARYRAAAVLQRRVARVGSGEIALEASPGVDLWSVDGDTRARLAGQAALLVRLPAGAVAVEHRLAVGVSASPLEDEDVGGEFELRPLSAVEFGVGVRIPL